MTDLEAKELLGNGHSLEELIELFSDKQEQHDLYVNSGLVKKDFEHIIEALQNQITTKESSSGAREYVISSDRIAHMHGVAEYMYKNAEKYGLDKEEMYLLGLLHDIGYINGKEGHEENGTSLLRRVNFPYHWDVLWHGISPQEYMSFTKKEELPASLILLLEANMSVNANGEELGFEVCKNEVANTYGLASEIYGTYEDTINWLRENKL